MTEIKPCTACYFFLPALMLLADAILMHWWPFMFVPSGVSAVVIPVTLAMALFYKKRIKADKWADKIPLYSGLFVYCVLIGRSLPYCGCRVPVITETRFGPGIPTEFSMTACFLLAIPAVIAAFACAWAPAKNRENVYYRIAAALPALLGYAALLTLPTVYLGGD